MNENVNVVQVCQAIRLPNDDVSDTAMRIKATRIKNFGALLPKRSVKEPALVPSKQPKSSK